MTVKMAAQEQLDQMKGNCFWQKFSCILTGQVRAFHLMEIHIDTTCSLTS